MYVTPGTALHPSYVYRLDYAPTGTPGAWQTWSIGPNDSVWKIYNRDVGGWIASNTSINEFITNCTTPPNADWTPCTAPTINNPWDGTGGSIVFNIGDTLSNYVGFKGNLDTIALDIAGAPAHTWDLELQAPVEPPVDGQPPCTNPDDRLNELCEEPWQTAAVYCRNEGVHIYAINESNSRGTLVIDETMEDLAEMGVPEGLPQLLAQSPDGKVRLYRLPDGKFQVNSPITDVVRGYLFNGYVFRWEGCPGG